MIHKTNDIQDFKRNSLYSYLESTTPKDSKSPFCAPSWALHVYPVFEDKAKRSDKNGSREKLH